MTRPMRTDFDTLRRHFRDRPEGARTWTRSCCVVLALSLALPAGLAPSPAIADDCSICTARHKSLRALQSARTRDRDFGAVDVGTSTPPETAAAEDPPHVRPGSGKSTITPTLEAEPADAGPGGPAGGVSRKLVVPKM